MRTFKRGDKVTVQFEGIVSSVSEKYKTVAVNVKMEEKNPDSHQIIDISADRILKHEISEPSEPETVVKVDGRIFVAGKMPPHNTLLWYSKTYRYTWEELQTLGDIEIIHEPESEDV